MLQNVEYLLFMSLIKFSMYYIHIFEQHVKIKPEKADNCAFKNKLCTQWEEYGENNIALFGHT